MARVIRLVFMAETTAAATRIGLLAEVAETTATRTEAAGARIARTWGRVGTGMTAAGRGLVMMTAPVVAFGYESFKASVKFQQAMEMIHTQAGIGQKDVNALSKGVLQYSKSQQTMFNPTELAHGLYHIEAVYSGLTKQHLTNAKALQFLKIASDAAAIGNTKLENTATALASVQVTQMRGAGDLKQVMGALNAVVGTGNMTWADLNQALSMQIMPAAKNVGMTIQDTGAAIATLADVTGNASSSAAQLRTSLHYVVAPTGRARKFLHAIGMGPYDMANAILQTGKLSSALVLLRGHLKGRSPLVQEQVMAAMFPQGRGAVQYTLFNNLDRYLQKTDSITARQKTSAESVAATHKTMAFKIKAALSDLGANMVQFGDNLKPFVQTWLPRIVKLATDLMKAFNGLSPTVKTLLIDFSVFGLLGGGALIFFGRLITAATQIYGAFVAIKGLAIGAWLVNLGGGAAAAAGPMGTLLAAMKGIAALALPVIAAYGIAKEAPKLQRAIAHHKPGKAAGIGAIVGALGLAGATAGLTAATGGLDIPLIAAMALLGGAGGAGAGAGATLLGGGRGFPTRPRVLRGYAPASRFASGGIGPDTEWSRLAMGEGVLTRATTARLGGQAGMNALENGMTPGGIEIHPSPITIRLDSRVIARGTVQYALSKAARGPSSITGGALVVGSPFSR